MCLYDAKGYVGELATNLGLWDTTVYVGKQKGIPKSKRFFKNGYTTNIDEVRMELESLHLNRKVEDVVKNLINLLGKCDSIAIINNGITNDPDDEEDEIIK